MKRTDFFSLPRPVQERFVASTRGQGAPTPLLVAKLPLPLAAIGWGVLSALAVAGWLGLVGLGYGNLQSSLALQPTLLLVAEGGLLVVAVVLGLMSRRSLRKRLRLPYVPTVYLFPIGAVDARSETIVTHGWDELTKLDTSASTARVAFAHGSFTFPLPSPDVGEELKARSAGYRETLTNPDSSDKDLVLLDPLRDNGFKNPFSPPDSMRPPKPKRLPLVELGLLLGAVGLAFGVFELRNHLGERAIYRRALLANSVEGYEAYLARGGKRSDVTDLHLPRAELRAAVAQNNVEAIEAFLDSHPHSKIDAEVKAALRAALLRALEEAKKKGTITALRAFEAKYAKHLKLVPELAGARVAYLSGILERFQKTASPSKELWLLARRLIVFADAHPGAKVLIRFTQVESHTLEKNEHLLSASAYYGGDKTLPSHFLVGAPARSAEQHAGAELAAALGHVFPSDLLRFEVGPPLPETPRGSPPPKFEEPTIVISYRLEISSPLVSKKPRGIYSAVGLVASAVLHIPDKEEPFEYKHTSWHAPDIRHVESGDLLPENVYGDILNKAWTKFTTRFAAPWVGS